MKIKLVIILLLFLKMGANAQIEKPIKWSYAAKRISPTEVLLYLKADIAVGWHIYSVNQKEGGPERTNFSFLFSKDFSVIGKIQEPKPVKKHEEVFDMDVFYFEKSVLFTQKIKLNKGEAVVKGKVSFMACTDKECLPPDEVEFSIPIK
ncbi:protein-disulfide reductase DsbD N-terminal domain-containing protein [Pedobacter frigoris]|uniref:Sugar transporter n=1 Tax=Pedobacter frigoris TaxID=2571272 RepID=A0A4V5P1Q3_9SPHI|nr:protein-disulfide reductase DsbD N-terminal domain-containing protein [Pedobacter frigoris]TKC04220.1 sugar transporter [Pedobacter frigoris]